MPNSKYSISISFSFFDFLIPYFPCPWLLCLPSPSLNLNPAPLILFLLLFIYSLLLPLLHLFHPAFTSLQFSFLLPEKAMWLQRPERQMVVGMCVRLFGKSPAGVASLMCWEMSHEAWAVCVFLWVCVLFVYFPKKILWSKDTPLAFNFTYCRKENLGLGPEWSLCCRWFRALRLTLIQKLSETKG